MGTTKILAAVHLYPPQHLCGGEMYLHNLLKHLQANGCEVRVLLLNARHYGITNVYTYDGVDVFPNEREVILNCLSWADTLITHLDYTEDVIEYGSIYKKPVVHLVHNNYKRPGIQDALRAQYVIYNSEHARASIGYKHEGIVLHPPCDWRKFDDGQDHHSQEHVTLINLDGNKGGHILAKIAAAMPEQKFIGVTGSYSAPDKAKGFSGQFTNQPGNVTVLPKQREIREIYAKTQILIMPSEYESWGMTATEAMASGIPVISTGGPGLRENCGKAGTYIADRDDIAAWVKAIKALQDPKKYKSQSALARKRARELDPLQELDRAADFIKGVRFYSQSTRGAVSTAASF